MQNPGDINKYRESRPYWLLLALVLFFAGQVATASHWHNDAAQLGDNSTLDIDCALCVLSSAAGAALIPHALIIAGIAFCAFFSVAKAGEFVSLRIRVYQSRAPPFIS